MDSFFLLFNISGQIVYRKKSDSQKYQVILVIYMLGLALTESGWVGYWKKSVIDGIVGDCRLVNMKRNILFGDLLSFCSCFLSLLFFCLVTDVRDDSDVCETCPASPLHGHWQSVTKTQSHFDGHSEHVVSMFVCLRSLTCCRCVFFVILFLLFVCLFSLTCCICRECSSTWNAWSFPLPRGWSTARRGWTGRISKMWKKSNIH